MTIKLMYIIFSAILLSCTDSPSIEKAVYYLEHYQSKSFQKYVQKHHQLLKKILEPDQSTLLHLAVQMNDLSSVKWLLKQEPSFINQQDLNGDTPLHLSIQEGNYNITQFLLKHKANVNLLNFAGYAPATLAIKESQYHLFKLLKQYHADLSLVFGEVEIQPQHTTINQGLNNKEKEFFQAVLDFDFAKVKSLLDDTNNSIRPYQQDLEGRNFLSNFLEKGNVFLIESHTKPLISNTTNQNNGVSEQINANSEVLNQEEATTQDFWNMIDGLVENRIDIFAKNNQGKNPLMIALEKKLPNIASRLIQYNAPMNEVDNQQNTLLHQLIFSYNDQDSLLYIRFISMFLLNGSDPNVKNMRGYTPLHLAATKGYTEILKILLDYKSQVDIQENEQGYTALHLAVLRESVSAVRLLLYAGASRDIRDHLGKTPFDIASESRNKEIIGAFK